MTVWEQCDNVERVASRCDNSNFPVVVWSKSLACYTGVRNAFNPEQFARELGLDPYLFVLISETWCETLGSRVATKTTWYVVAFWTSSDCGSQLSAGVAHTHIHTPPPRLKGKLDPKFLFAGVCCDCHPGLNYHQPSVVYHRLSIHLPDKQSSSELLCSVLRWWNGFWGSRAAGWPGLKGRVL